MTDFPDDAAIKPLPGVLGGIPVRGETSPACEDGGVFALRVLGDAMFPEFEDGDIIVVEPDGRVDDGAFVVARADGEWMLRQLRRIDGRWTLVALAPELPAHELANLDAVRGVVIQKSRPGRRKTIKRYV